MFGIGTSELIVILIVALLVLGPDKLPGIIKTVGKAMGEFKRLSTDVKSTLDAEMRRVEDEERKLELEEKKRKLEARKKAAAAKAEAAAGLGGAAEEPKAAAEAGAAKNDAPTAGGEGQA